jgi:flagellar motor switch protein FliN
MNNVSSSSMKMDALLDVPLNLRIELGSCVRPAESVLKLAAGSLVLLDSNPSGQAGIFIGDKLVARAEIIVVDRALALKVTSIGPNFPVSPAPAA